MRSRPCRLCGTAVFGRRREYAVSDANLRGWLELLLSIRRTLPPDWGRPRRAAEVQAVSMQKKSLAFL